MGCVFHLNRKQSRCGGSFCRCGGSLIAHQTSGAEVPGSNPASTHLVPQWSWCGAGSLCKKKSQGREGDLPLRQKKDIRKQSSKYSTNTCCEAHILQRWKSRSGSVSPLGNGVVCVEWGPIQSYTKIQETHHATAAKLWTNYLAWLDSY